MVVIHILWTMYTDNPDIIYTGFCTYFTEVGERFATAICKSKHNYKHYLNNNSCTKLLFMSSTDPVETKHSNFVLQTKTISVHDGIGKQFLKILSASICDPITLIKE